MRFSFREQNVFAGFAERYARGGETGQILVRGILTSDDGERLVQPLTQISAVLLSRVPQGSMLPESQIDHLVAIQHRGGLVEVWINEPRLLINVKSKRDLSTGEPVFDDDFADISELRFHGLEIPDEVGYIVMFSVGWRRALVFDFTPLVPPQTSRKRDLPQVLGGLYAYLRFRNRFILTDEEWKQLLEQKWFPFIGLTTSLVDEMIHHAHAGWPVDELLPKIVAVVRQGLSSTRKSIESAPIFSRHRKLLLDALSAFERGEHALAISGVFPRIEGILRDHHALRGIGKPSPIRISETAASTIGNPEFSLLLPLRFSEYLRTVFFASEDFTDPTKVVQVTRHAVSHGVASDELLDEKAATIAVLLLQQLAYLLPGGSAKP